jgi:hypothetical protein
MAASSAPPTPFASRVRRTAGLAGRSAGGGDERRSVAGGQFAAQRDAALLQRQVFRMLQRQAGKSALQRVQREAAVDRRQIQGTGFAAEEVARKLVEHDDLGQPVGRRRTEPEVRGRLRAHFTFAR